MNRQPLIEMLDRYGVLHPEEAAVAGRIRHLVENHTDCFERTCRPGHITGSAWIVSHDGRRCLLLHHRKLGRWLQPGGHADGECHVAEVALREAQEETGLRSLALVSTGDGTAFDGSPMPFDLDVHDIPARYDAAGRLLEDAHEHHDVRFLLTADAEEPLVVSDESTDLRWFTHEEVLAATDELSVLRMLHKAGPKPLGG